MSIHVDWDNEEKTILRWTYSPGWTWEEAYQARDYEKTLMETVPHIVDSIGDLTQTSNIPAGALTKIVNVMTKRHERIGISMLVGSNRFVQLIYDMVRKVHAGPLERARLYLVPTFEEAYAMIEADRAKRAKSIG